MTGKVTRQLVMTRRDLIRPGQAPEPKRRPIRPPEQVTTTTLAFRGWGDLSQVVAGFLWTALWAETFDAYDEQGEEITVSFEDRYRLDNFTHDSWLKAYAACAPLLSRFNDIFVEEDRIRTFVQRSAYWSAGSDLWLTQAGHGSGFFDGDWPDDAVERMSEYAESVGPYGLMPGIGDDVEICPA